MSEPIVELARAKINLTLRVLGRRPDGYHELESLVAFADVGDVLTLQPEAPFGVTVTGPFARAIDGANLVETAARRVSERARAAGLGDIAVGGITLDKRLPVAAGLGGGSADAAALLRAIVRANAGPPVDAAAREARLDLGEVVRALAPELGADVPVCLGATAAVMRGLGEIVEPLGRPLPPVAVVLANPGVPLATGPVFQRLAAAALAEVAAVRRLPDGFASLDDLLACIAAAGNDLEAPALALCPAIADVLAALRGLPGCRYAAQSGSGPTCFGLFATLAEAQAARARLASAEPGWWVAAAGLR